MNDFEKQIEEQWETHKMQLENDLKRLYWLIENLGIYSKSKLNATLEFVYLFSRLKSEGVIKELSDSTP